MLVLAYSCTAPGTLPKYQPSSRHPAKFDMLHIPAQYLVCGMDIPYSVRCTAPGVLLTLIYYIFLNSYRCLISFICHISDIASTIKHQSGAQTLINMSVTSDIRYWALKSDIGYLREQSDIQYQKCFFHVYVHVHVHAHV